MAFNIKIDKPDWIFSSYLIGVLIISTASFFVYSPLYHPYFNSDHAVHVLMTHYYKYPEGLFYWGQNRLGSLLPDVARILVKYFNVHPLNAVSIINHLFLLTSYFILSIPLKNYLYKIILCVFIFFPLYTYNALLLAGHPYSSQLFAGLVSLFLLSKVYNKLISENVTFKSILIWIYSLAGGFFLWVSIWISEFSYVTGVLILLFLLFNYKKLIPLKFLFLKEKVLSVLFILLNAVNLFIWYSKIKQYKNYFMKDELYDQVFLNDLTQINQQFVWMKQKVVAGLDFTGINGDTTYSYFYWGLIFIFLISLFFYRSSQFGKPLHLAVTGTVLTGVVMLFFSTWNFRSEYEPRYYTIIIVMIVAGLLYISEGLLKNKIGLITSAFWLMIVGCLLKNNSNVVLPFKESVVDKYKEFRELPEGGLIGGYWWAYKVNAVSPYNLKSVPIQNDAQRNQFMIWEVVDMPIVYIIKNDYLDMSKPMPDTLYQFDMRMIKIEPGERQIGDAVFGVYSKYR